MIAQTKAQFLTEALVETLNNEWKVKAIESHNMLWHRLEIQEGKRYLKVWNRLIQNGDENGSRSMWMFVDKNTGACYKPASCKAPAVGIRYQIEDLIEDPAICDPFGSFLYIR